MAETQLAVRPQIESRPTTDDEPVVWWIGDIMYR
jgi:hypothetical protein